MSSGTSTEGTTGEDLQPLKSSEYERQGTTARYLGLADTETFSRLKADEGVQEIFQHSFNEHIKPQYEQVTESLTAGERRQRENLPHFKAFGKIMIADDNGERKYQKGRPVENTVTDGFAVAVTRIIANMDTFSDSPLYHRRDYCLHAKRCMGWSLLKRMKYEAGPARKAKADETKVKAELRAKRKATKELQKNAKGRGNGAGERRKVNDRPATPSEGGIELEEETEEEDVGPIISRSRKASQNSASTRRVAPRTRAQHKTPLPQNHLSHRQQAPQGFPAVRGSVSVRDITVLEELPEQEESEFKQTVEE